jgi:hypothetical protein
MASGSIAYQKALALQAIGLIDAAAGNTSAAVTHLTEALYRARRTTGEGYTFQWPVAFVLDSLGDVTALEDRLRRTGAPVRERRSTRSMASRRGRARPPAARQALGSSRLAPG